MNTKYKTYILLTFLFWTTSSYGFNWNKYSEALKKQNIQKNCMPRKIEPVNNLAVGTVIMFHGFTACPQQYFEIAEQLANIGYRVYLPLLPGHGGNWINSDSPYKNLPVPSNVNKKFKNFVQNMNNLMRKEKGRKIIVGLSVGASVAQYAVNISPSLYDQALIIAPFLRTSKENFQLRPLVSDVLGRIPFIKEKRIGWGENCEIEERNNGRAGTCHFTLRNIAALQKFGKKVLNTQTITKTKIQYVGVKKDLAVSNKKILNLVYKNIQFDNIISYCLYPYPANHSLISRFDTPFEDKFWLDDILYKIRNYIESVEFFPKIDCM
jgi:esterase/lipase